ncbi:UNVERIFIED_CONTAM: leucine-rich repeat domain-containing protein, partial [Bacteroidetes bacterium 56_B9]
LETVKIGNGVTNIGGYYQYAVFEGCNNITTLVIGDGLTTLNNQFSGKTKLANVTLGKGFKELNGTFNGCTALETITLPEHLRVIGNSTFQECTNLT